MIKLRRNFKKTLEIYQRRKKLIASLVLVASILFPLYISLRDILLEGIPFWYDPARDLLSALDNLKKPTLIGPPSGIPGIFYGPYWIWLLSFGLIFTKDPRAAAILILTVPYFTIFPLLLFRLAKIFGIRVSVILWLLFIFGYKTYTTFIWNPHLAPLFLLGLIYVLIFTDLHLANGKNYLRLTLAGFLSGLLINFHISFGISLAAATAIFLLLEFFIFTPAKKWREYWLGRIFFLASYTLGLFLAFLPNLIFEIRHGFQQTQAIIHTLTNAFLYNSAVVGYLGLSKTDIIKEFAKIPDKLLSIPSNITYIVYLLIFLHLFLKHKVYLNIGKLTKKLLLLLSIAIFTLLAVFLTSRNPIWSYHFIGTEIIILLSLGFVLSKFAILRNITTIWVVALVFLNIYQLTKPVEVYQFKFSDLATKKHIVETVYQDAQRQPFAVAAYSPAIYTFDYDYIFRWFGTDKYRNQLPKDPKEVKYVYLIIPKVSEDVKVDFINYRTPNKEFQTAREWHIPDGTTIIKRERISIKT